ncbi:uncharacterized protein LOC141909188 [Tubulanus polymorphus]|uniref:uncharacterized protein LOC141909188 n=1 Tax=Tubulanus polymorphus TaxID=672921 RepID=UPI003DA62760
MTSFVQYACLLLMLVQDVMSLWCFECSGNNTIGYGTYKGHTYQQNCEDKFDMKFGTKDPKMVLKKCEIENGYCTKCIHTHVDGTGGTAWMRGCHKMCDDLKVVRNGKNESLYCCQADGCNSASALNTEFYLSISSSLVTIFTMQIKFFFNF